MHLVNPYHMFKSLCQQEIPHTNNNISRSSCLEAFYKKGTHNNFTKFKGKQSCRSFFLNKREFFLVLEFFITK